MDKSNIKRKEQLQMPFGTACNRLRKNIIFNLAQIAKLDSCFRCSNKIDTIEEFSIEHKEPWLDSENPSEKFFDWSNIAFSHVCCNTSCARRPLKKYFTQEERDEVHRKCNAAYARKVYTTERRRKKKQTTGW